MREHFVTADSFFDGEWKPAGLLMKHLDDAVVVWRGGHDFDRLCIVEVQAGWPLGDRYAQRLAFVHLKFFENPMGHLDTILVMVSQLRHADE